MIKQVRLINCQSWKDATIDLSSTKLNIIRAPNNTGKSVLFKMFKISASPKYWVREKASDLIRWGAQSAQAMYLFEDGCMAAVVVYPNRVLYLFKEADSENWKSSFEPSAKMIDELGFLVSDSGKLVANIIDKDQSLMLVDSDSRSTLEFIDMLCNNATLDDYRAKVKDLVKTANEDLTQIDSRLMRVGYELERVDYTDIDAMQYRLDRLVLARDVMYSLISIGMRINNLQSSLVFAKDYDLLEGVLGVVLQLESVVLGGCFVQAFNEDDIVICEVTQGLEELILLDVMPEKQPPSMKFVELLEGFEDMALRDVEVEKCPPPIELVESLEVMSGIRLQDLAVLRKPVDTVWVDLLQELECCGQAIGTVRACCKSARGIAEEIKVLKQEFADCGSKYSCEIYGEVIFDGKNCVPYSY